MLAAIARSLRRHPTSTSSRGIAGPVVRDVADRRRPHEPVARLVAAARRVDDRARRLPSARVVLDDEDQQRLRQEARLEDASPVLVRDPALPAVADRLDHRHADVPGRLLDGVDHRLDALADHHGLDLDHVITSLRRSIRTVSRHRPSRLAIAPADTDDAEADAVVQPQRCRVLGEDRRLKRPDAGALALLDQPFHKRAPDPAALPVARDVDARLGHAAIRPARRRRAARRPADHALVELGDDADRMGRMPCLPRRHFGLERRHAAAHPVAVDRRDLRPVIGAEVADQHVDSRR